MLSTAPFRDFIVEKRLTFIKKKIVQSGGFLIFLGQILNIFLPLRKESWRTVR